MGGVQKWNREPRLSDPLPTQHDVERHARLLRIDGKPTTAWILQRLALETNLK